MKNPHIGSSFESFLEEDGMRDEILDLAQKRVLAWQIAEDLKEREIKKVEMAERRTGSSRPGSGRDGSP